MKNVKMEWIVAGSLCLALVAFPGISRAGVGIEIGIPPVNVAIGVPPPLVIGAPPEVEVVPGTYVYFAPDVGVDLFFYDGLWYRDYQGRWFSCASYDGPWVFVASPPGVLVGLPPNFRVLAAAGPRIAYRDLRANWRTWHSGNYWAKRAFWGRPRERGAAPGFRGGEERQHGVAPSFGGNRGDGGFHGAGRPNMSRGGMGRRGR